MPAPTVETATETLAKLATSHQEALRKQDELTIERRSISFKAHTGDAGARKRLTEINLEMATISSEIASFIEAIGEGKVQLANAQEVAAREKLKQQGFEVQQRMKEFRKHGRELDRMVTQLVERYQQFEAEIRGITTDFGIARPDPSLVRIGCKRALIAALMATPLELQHLAPSERHTFSQLIGGWAASIEGWASRAIGEPVENEEAA